MLKIITINDDEQTNKKIHNIIDKILMKYDFNYKYYNFNHDNKLEDFLKTKNKTTIYIINNSNDILDIISKIRNDYKQYNAFIFIININNRELKKQIIKNYPFNIKIINNIDNQEEVIKDCLNYILKALSNNDDVLIIKSEGTIRFIPYEEILYIEKQPNVKTLDIVTTTNIIPVNKTLKDLNSQLTKKFIQTHRSAIINKENVKEFNLKDNKIIFYNGQECNLISRNYKKIISKEVQKTTV